MAHMEDMMHQEAPEKLLTACWPTDCDLFLEGKACGLTSFGFILVDEIISTQDTVTIFLQKMLHVWNNFIK